MKIDFKLDENLPKKLKTFLLEKGFNVYDVFDQNLNGKPDSEIVKILQNEDVVFVTLDYDFADIRFNPPENSSGCIVLNLKNQSIDAVVSLFKSVLVKLESEKIRNTLWIVDENKIRIRE
jgi:predicted nuclease of predicted toxin-antitoxin system